MQHITRRTTLGFILAGLAGCGKTAAHEPDVPLYPNETPELRALIEKYAALYDVPVALVQKVVIRESTHRPKARNGPYYGLMQILPQTATSMDTKVAHKDCSMQKPT